MKEELAERLYLAHWKSSAVLVGADVLPFAQQPKANRSAWIEVARECIRQMEWSRREMFAACSSSMTDAAFEGPPIALAPKNWKP